MFESHGDPYPTTYNMKTKPIYVDTTPVIPDRSNQIRFHGTMEEFKRYLPELYEKMIKK
jgi:hypothetical protein